ncbi:hypothetical protein C8R44DRAFT_856624 [Mycena epipterygia]|nr:hypothetical protein C8R44DRAFT_856624 [Mycena epipterygia]
MAEVDTTGRVRTRPVHQKRSMDRGGDKLRVEYGWGKASERLAEKERWKVVEGLCGGVEGEKWSPLHATENSGNEISGAPEVTFRCYHIGFDLWGQISKATGIPSARDHAQCTAISSPKPDETYIGKQSLTRQTTYGIYGNKIKASEITTCSAALRQERSVDVGKVTQEKACREKQFEGTCNRVAGGEA